LYCKANLPFATVIKSLLQSTPLEHVYAKLTYHQNVFETARIAEAKLVTTNLAFFSCKLEDISLCNWNMQYKQSTWRHICSFICTLANKQKGVAKNTNWFVFCQQQRALWKTTLLEVSQGTEVSPPILTEVKCDNCTKHL